MSIKIIEGSIFDATKGSVIIQQVNACNRMASGIALAIYTRYLQVKTDYHKFCEGKTKDELMGKVYRTETEDYTFYGLFGQENYGNSAETKKIYTDYDAVETGLKMIAKEVDKNNTIVIPYKMSCGLAGGDWNRVYEIIERVLGDYEVEIYRLEK